MLNLDFKKILGFLKHRSVKTGQMVTRDWAVMLSLFLLLLIVVIGWSGSRIYLRLSQGEVIPAESESLQTERLQKLSSTLKERQQQFEALLKTRPTIIDPAF